MTSVVTTLHGPNEGGVTLSSTFDCGKYRRMYFKNREEESKNIMLNYELFIKDLLNLENSKAFAIQHVCTGLKILHVLLPLSRAVHLCLCI